MIVCLRRSGFQAPSHPPDQRKRSLSSGKCLRAAEVRPDGENVSSP